MSNHPNMISTPERHKKFTDTFLWYTPTQNICIVSRFMEENCSCGLRWPHIGVPLFYQGHWFIEEAIKLQLFLINDCKEAIILTAVATLDFTLNRCLIWSKWKWFETMSLLGNFVYFTSLFKRKYFKENETQSTILVIPHTLYVVQKKRVQQGEREEIQLH